MPRNPGTGVYTLPEPAVVYNTVVSPTWANSTFSDIAAALTASLSIDGSVTPAKFNNDQVGFQQKMGLYDFLNEYSAKLDFLEDVNASKIGDIEPFADDAVPANYLECNGNAVSRATYAALYAVIGDTFGAGNGTTTFNLPDLRASTVRGSSDTQPRGVEQTGQVGAHTHTASTAAANAHSHTGTTASAGTHGHTATAGSAGGHTHTGSGTSGGQSANHTHGFSGTSSSSGAHSHTVGFGVADANSQGSDRTWVTSLGSGTGKTSSAVGNHTHTVSGTTGADSATHAHAFSLTSSAAGGHNHDITIANSASHTHSFTTSTDGAHSHTITVSSTGGEGAVPNVALMYCIRYKDQ